MYKPVELQRKLLKHFCHSFFSLVSCYWSAFQLHSLSIHLLFSGNFDLHSTSFSSVWFRQPVEPFMYNSQGKGNLTCQSASLNGSLCVVWVYMFQTDPPACSRRYRSPPCFSGNNMAKVYLLLCSSEGGQVLGNDSRTPPHHRQVVRTHRSLLGQLPHVLVRIAQLCDGLQGETINTERAWAASRNTRISRSIRGIGWRSDDFRFDHPTSYFSPQTVNKTRSVLNNTLCCDDLNLAFILFSAANLLYNLLFKLPASFCDGTFGNA